ncbi:harpin HrpZ family protein [Klebsiella indica]|uniref:Type III secretion protein HrpN n=1 Tax=Klebsiella indica TaxID=2582917 RepID=A0A5R9LE51_9ENTR|nr:harpin HrpZ family protein [Klebsiella indica]TLV11629.1 type III secretion protein HrpN [Klebsiella indica]
MSLGSIIGSATQPTTLNITITAGSRGAGGFGAGNQYNGLGAQGGTDAINKLAGMLTSMMMMSMMGGGLLGGGLLGGGGLGNLFGGGGLGGFGSGLGSSLGGGAGGALGGALGGPLGAALGNSLGSSLGDAMGSGVGSSLDQALGSKPTSSYLPNSGSGGGTDSAASDPLQQLSMLFSEVLKDILGGGQDSGAQGNSGTGRQPTAGEQQAYTQGVSDALSALLSNGLSQSLGKGGLGGAPLQLGNGGLQGLSGAGDFGQLGNAVGLGIGQKAGIEALNAIGTHSDSATRSFINKEDRPMAKEIGQFMDQYPEVFGKPQYQKDDWTTAKTDDKSWATALSDPDDDGMTPGSMDQFNKAKGMIKSAMAGDFSNSNLQAHGAGGSSLGIDAALTGDAISNMALGKLAA